MAAGQNSAVQWIVRTLGDQLSQVFETMAGEAPLIELAAEHAPPAGDDVMAWEIPISLTPQPPVWVVARRDSWHLLGDKVLCGAGLEGSDEQTILDTFKESLDQAFGGLAREMTLKTGREVLSSPGKVIVAGTYGTSDWTKLELVFSDNRSSALLIGVAEEIAQKLDKRPEATPAKPASASVAQAAAGGAGGGHSVPDASRTMELLLDVELPISVSFGRAHLPLKDVMKLTTGSIVELNRTVSEPVDIIVNNCVIARGEVVVVEGNFGVRIQEVISRQERLRTLY